MNFKISIILFFGFYVSVLQTLGEPPKVRFYPREELTYCADCRGDLIQSGRYYKFKFRLENLSGKDLIVYGHQYDPSTGFNFLQTFQSKNPHICEWQYPYGSSDERCGWGCLSSFDKNEKMLKPGEYLETEGGILENDRVPKRVMAYVGAEEDQEPYPIFSEPYQMTKTDDENPKIMIGEETCTPACNLSIDQAPAMRGLKLGMTLAEFKIRFPKIEVSRIGHTKYDFKTAWLWDWGEDIFSADISFLDDRIVRIEFKIKSLESTRTRKDFYRLVADKIKLPYYWEPDFQRWECREFLISVLPNEMPTITIVNKAFIKVQEDMVEEDMKRLTPKN